MKTNVLILLLALGTLSCKEEVVTPDLDNKNSFSPTSQADTAAWVRKADISNIRRAEAVGFSIGHKGYIGTGISTNNIYLKDFWEYDPNSDSWTQKSDIGGSARRKAVGFSIGSKGYIGTGVTQSGSLADFWEYDANKNTWVNKADVPGGGRFGAVGFSISSKGYIGTGSPEDFVYLKDFYEYNPNKDSWTQRTDFGGEARALAAAFSLHGKGYIGTGVGSNGSPDGILQDLWEYVPSSDCWTERASLPVRTAAAVGFQILNEGFIGTGAAENPRADFYNYNPVKNTWTRIADFGGGERVSAVGFSIGPKGYVGTGFLPSASPEDQKDFWQMRPNK